MLHKLLQLEGSFNSDTLLELKEMTRQFPYFAQAHILLAKALTDLNDLQARQYCEFASIYATNRQHYFFTLFPEKKQFAKPNRIARESMHTGDYFSMIEKSNNNEQDPKQSLKSLAERLKAARAHLQTNHKTEVKPIATTISEVESQPIQLEFELPEPEKATRAHEMFMKSEFSTPHSFITQTSKADGIVQSTDYFKVAEDALEFTEENAKKLIKEHKYAQAIAILHVLDLNNPKKSSYFADQIRFLEKIIEIKKNKQ